MKAEEMWAEYCNNCGIDESTPYEAWAFGDAPDTLVRLVLEGMKVATASAYDLYALDESEPMPKVGDYSVILDSQDNAVCIIKTIKLDVVPFNQVTSGFAFMEGEGDRSLAYWRRVHKEFFTKELKEYGLEFSEDMKVLCEEFKLLYAPFAF